MRNNFISKSITCRTVFENYDRHHCDASSTRVYNVYRTKIPRLQLFMRRGAQEPMNSMVLRPERLLEKKQGTSKECYQPVTATLKFKKSQNA